VTRKKASFDSVPQWGAEFAPARRWLPAAGGDRAWAVRTGSGPPNQGDPPDEGRRSTQVAGSTKVVVCEGVVITSIQPTPKSFRVNTDDDAATSKVKHLENCAAQDSSKTSPAGPET